MHRQVNSGRRAGFRRVLPALIVAAAWCGGHAGAGRAARAAEPVVIDLWPAGKVPGESADLGPEKLTEKDGVVTSITNVSKPSIKVYPAPKDTATGAALLIAPGGGYNSLAWDHEGEQVAAWANSLGVTGVILKYRVPRRPDAAKDQPPVGALQDAQRAMGIVRARAAAWGVDPKRVGMLGFSAGGHLAAWASTNFDKRAYDAVDDADRQDIRPDFVVMVYPGGAVERGTTQLKPEIRVTKETPPSFLTMSTDDRVGSENCVALYLALKQAGVPVEMHLYAKGGHGYGLRPTAGVPATWTKRCEEWMGVIGVLKGKE